MENIQYEVVWPRGRKTVGNVPLARRLEALEGKTIGELWDWLFHGEQYYPAIEKELARRYPRVRFVGYETFGSTLARAGGLLNPEEEAEVLAEIPEKLRQNKCDAVVSGLGF
ncbi:MAG: hypothetical protein HY673_16880 [Chloroflexi bacterium]|nr:hypothetical protein [Chloroflexota bacterium]